MAQKLIPWNTGGGNIVVNYSGSGNDTVTVGSDTDNNSSSPRSQVLTITTTAGGTVSRTVTITQSGKSIPIGTVFNFAYTGTVQSQELAPGTYKLQVWGAQGGQNPAYSTYGIISVDGGKGGYSEGILTLTSPTTLYIFVGGQPNTTSTHGGWNGGGGGSGTTQNGTPTDTYGLGYTKFGRGGGGTDIALTTSTMNYGNYDRTQRSNASLLSRFIVAGGGSGGAMAYREKTTTTTEWETVGTLVIGGGTFNGHAYTTSQFVSSGKYYTRFNFAAGDELFSAGDKLRITLDGSFDYLQVLWTTGSSNTYLARDVTSTPVTFDYIVCPSSSYYFRVQVRNPTAHYSGTVLIERQVTTTTTSTDTLSQPGYYGGGTSGGGLSSFAGKQDTAGGGAQFGFGRNQAGTEYRYVGAAGGGGWYGGGNSYGNQTDDMSAIGYSGGGSGFVNISANSSYRPTGYTGLELDSGATYAGDTSFPSTSGSTETGHEGNGYARITCIDPNLLVPLTFDILGSGTIGWKTSGSSLTRTIQYKKNNGSWTSITSSTSGVTISVSSGDVLQFRGNNTAYGNSSYYNNFTSTCEFNVRGNIMSLINSTNFDSLTSLSATYTFMALFSGALVKDASNLQMPATTLTNYCYQYMFYSSSSTGTITKAPTLPATTLKNYCYRGMFQGCPNLNYIKCLATSISATSCTSNWVSGVAASGTFVKASTMSSWTTGTAGIPSGWTVENASS